MVSSPGSRLPTAADIADAAARLDGVAVRTPLLTAPALDAATGARVLVKPEVLQRTGSFKFRGAYNRISRLNAAERASGVVAFSSGNHGQAVAAVARLLTLPATIVMPADAPAMKIDATRSHGASVVLYDRDRDDREEIAGRIVRDKRATLVPPFDDPLVIAGQGTIGAEILRHSQDRLSAVFVPVGGGGLISGIAGYIKTLRPDVKIIGVEPFEADAMYRSLAVGRRVHLEHVGIFADGVAVREVGERTFPIVRQTVDEVLRVTNDEICAAIKDIFDDTRTIMEPAGALATAGLKTWVEREGARNQSLAAVLSGANINFDRLRFVAERAEVGEARETLIAITLPERPGSFQKFCSVIGRRTVTEFNYRLSGRQQAHIFVGFATQSRQDGSALASQLVAAGYETVDLTDNELAKLHVRHMVGGHAPEVHNERLCRFEFPERPGALAQFLEKLGGRWNISLFHYRNHGADFGRVLAGFEVDDSDLSSFTTFLDELAYPYTLEYENPAYKFFLG
jgi:threonine dehydratase